MLHINYQSCLFVAVTSVAGNYNETHNQAGTINIFNNAEHVTIGGKGIEVVNGAKRFVITQCCPTAKPLAKFGP